MHSETDVHTTHHVESLRRTACYYWPYQSHTYARKIVSYNQCHFRPALNLRALISALSREQVTGGQKDQLENGDTLGKRKRLESPGSSKRIRLDNNEGRGVSSCDLEESREVDVGPGNKQIYPSFWESSDVINDANRTENTSFLQVYQFGMHLRYNKMVVHSQKENYADDEAAANMGWIKEEDRLCSLLQDRQRDTTLLQDIDMGKLVIMRYHGRLLAISYRSSRHFIEHSEKWMLLLPDIPWPDGLGEEGFGGQNVLPMDIHRNFFTACAFFQSYRRAKLEADLRLHVLPEGTYDPTCDLPFELRAQFTLSFATSKTCNPFEGFSQGVLSDLESLQRRFLCLLSKTPLTRLVDGDFTGEEMDATIPFFLKIMRPAPPLPDVNYDSLQPDGLLSTLLPFQRRTVAWMLEREGKRITPTGTVAPIDDLEASSSTQGRSLPVFWEEIKMGGQNFYLNHLTSDLSLTPPEPHPALGGILAEEPGLGKTMECLSLVLLNPAPERNPSNQRWDPEAQLRVREIKTTLIVTPPALATQWADELAAHAPGLKVFVYEGWMKLQVPITEADIEARRDQQRLPLKTVTGQKTKRKGRAKNSDDATSLASNIASNSDTLLDWPHFINQFDICITTYNVLRLDLTVARAPPDRPRRQAAANSSRRRPRSPLVMCEWYRVIMDEVQMMGMGASEAMVSLIPRLSSFAVSGTPARAQVSDLISVLKFLRIDDLVSPTRMWNKLLKHENKDLFAALFQRYSVRTLKESVKNELTIPQQQRYLVPIELGRVERHVYDQAVEEALIELGLDARGVATHEGWDVDASVLRNVLRRLRGICTHPQVGQLLKPGDKKNKSGTLKNMAEVLESMKDQNWRNLMEDRRAKILTWTRLAQLQQHQSEDRDRYQRALEHLLTAELEANQFIDEIKAAIAQHSLRGEVLKNEAKALQDSRKLNLANEQHADKGKGKDFDFEHNSNLDVDSGDSDDDDVEDRGLPKTPAGEEHRAKRMALTARLRECVMVLHRAKFLQGDIYHVLGSSYSNKEDAAYESAERLRKDLLKSTEEAANRAMRRLSTSTTEKRVTERTLQIRLPFMKGGGIRSTHLFEEANEIIEDVLNNQSTLLWEWRIQIVELLTQKLSAGEEQADGEEYARTLDTQGAAETYLQAYTALLADRRESIAAERTLLAAHEGREKKTRKTKAAARAEIDAQENLEIPDDVEVQPQHEVLYGELSEQRKDIVSSGRALKSVLVDLTALGARLKEDDIEKTIAKDGATRLRELIASLQEVTEKLDADLAVLRKVFNDRIQYFRQLQDISDTVAEVEWEGTVSNAMEATRLENASLAANINTSRARQRYLEHLAEGGSGVDEEDIICIVCQCEFIGGFITQCGHVCCEKCMRAWISHIRGRACPVCRAPLDSSQLQHFTAKEDRPPPPKPEPVSIPASRREIRYNMIDPTLFTDIQSIEADGNYGSKIQTLVRHLLHIQLVDPGAKSIVFSAWADSLTIIEHALDLNGISCLRLDQNQGKGRYGGAKKFRVDPSLQVLLLHGERDNAGLNVTCASRVFLLESVVNHGFEVQAIARIDRMGQTRATEVFCYYAEDTVEKNILDLAARQGLSLYTKDNSAGSVNVTSFATDSEKKLVDAPVRSSAKQGQRAQKGDFIFKVNDMLAILFPHMFEDIEFLLPPDARDTDSAGKASGSSVNGLEAGPVRPPGRRLHVNAEAGPSRLPSF